MEHIYYENKKILVLDTSKKRICEPDYGVDERIRHPTRFLDEAIRKLIAVGNHIFEEDFILLSDRYSSINYHWHIVANDLYSEAEDYKQIMEISLNTH